MKEHHMTSLVTKILKANTSLKIASLIMGYLMWSFVGQYYPIQVSLAIPLAFYSIPDAFTIDAPDTINIMLSGKRMFFDQLSLADLSAHIHAGKFREGTHALSISADTLFLPPGISVVHYTPSPLVINVHKHTSIKETYTS